MARIYSESILSEIVMENSFILPALYLIGIRVGLGKKTIREISKEKNINEDFLICLISAYTDNNFSLTETLPSYSILQLSNLTSELYPLLFQKMESNINQIINCISGNESELCKKLENMLTLYKSNIIKRYDEIQKTVIPHIATAYELYYSPHFTSGKSNILKYSLEFYDDYSIESEKDYNKIAELLDSLLDKVTNNLNIYENIFAFHQLQMSFMSQNRMEQKLLKPMVLEMEEKIITTFHKNRKPTRRNTFLSIPTNNHPNELLSPREKEVLKLVAQGFINKEIADSLNIGITTVITHRKNIVEKLGIKTIPGLTVYAYTQGFLDESILTNED